MLALAGLVLLYVGQSNRYFADSKCLPIGPTLTTRHRLELEQIAPAGR